MVSAKNVEAICENFNDQLLPNEQVMVGVRLLHKPQTVECIANQASCNNIADRMHLVN